MKKLSFLIGIATMVFCGKIIAAELSSADIVQAKGNTEVSISLPNSVSVKASIVTVELPREYIYSDAFRWGGDNHQPPKFVVKEIKVARNGHEIFIPLSAFSDIGEPRHIKLEAVPKSQSNFRLIIRGGDAGGSYSATLEFKDDDILLKRVASGEFPKVAWEEIHYSFNHLDN